MRLRELHRILHQVVLAGLPVGAGACLDGVLPGQQCYEQVDRVIPIQTPADPSLQLKIDSCRVDVDACNELCAMAMQRSGIPGGPTGCKVEFQGSVVAVAVRYEVSHDGANCPVEGRRPAGLASPDGVRAATAAGAW